MHKSLKLNEGMVKWKTLNFCLGQTNCVNIELYNYIVHKILERNPR